jgi:hypothetical protein
MNAHGSLILLEHFSRTVYLPTAGFCYRDLGHDRPDPPLAA